MDKNINTSSFSQDLVSDAISSICEATSSLSEGCRLPVKMKNEVNGANEWNLAEIVSIKDDLYYVHYVDCKF